MLEIIKKTIITLAALALLLLLMYVAFYLFLVVLAFILVMTLYMRWKGISPQNFRQKPAHYWWKHKPGDPHHPATTHGKTVIIEAEYEEVDGDR